MTSEKREAAESAWEKFVAQCWEVDEEPTSLERELYLNGYHQGHAVASRWHSIERDGLPNYDDVGPWLFRSSLGGFTVHWHSSHVFNHAYTHYQKIQPPHEGETNDD